MKPRFLIKNAYYVVPSPSTALNLTKNTLNVIIPELILILFFDLKKQVNVVLFDEMVLLPYPGVWGFFDSPPCIYITKLRSGSVKSSSHVFTDPECTNPECFTKFTICYDFLMFENQNKQRDANITVCFYKTKKKDNSGFVKIYDELFLECIVSLGFLSTHQICCCCRMLHDFLLF